jgi:hypothetical protein
MNIHKSPELYKRLTKSPPIKSNDTTNNVGPAPICIHAHKINLPLLADFPKNRIDINPFLSECKYLPDYDWTSRTIDAASILKTVRMTTSASAVAVFLDSFTIENALPVNLKKVDLPIHLFLGDTQHGPAEGFWRLIELAKTENFEKIIATNNPQHLHFFEAAGVDKSKLFFCPLGIANASSNIFEHIQERCAQIPKAKEYLKGQLTFVGSITDHHLRRKRIANSLSSLGLCNIIKTRDYRDAAVIHSLSKACLNISLNSDINFRFSEVLGSGGVLVTDDLAPIQKSYVQRFYGSQGIAYYGSQNDLIRTIKEDDLDCITCNLDSSESQLAHNRKANVYLDSLNDLDKYIVKYGDDERRDLEHGIRTLYQEYILCGQLRERVDRYIYWRDQAMALSDISDNTSIVFPESECPLTLLDISDLSFSSIKINPLNISHAFVASQLTKLGWKNISL